MVTDILLICAALLVLVFLSVVESAYESLTEVSLRMLGDETGGSRRKEFFQELMQDRLKFELALVMGTQLSIILTVLLFIDIEQRAGLPFPILVTLAAGFIIVLLFRQLLPRMIAQNRPDRVFWSFLPAFRAIYRVLYLFIAPVAGILARSRNDEPEPITEQTETDEARDEIQAFIDVGEEQGILEGSEGEMIQSIVDLRETRVGEIMRPRPHMVAIESTATVADARRLAIESKYSRIPVYKDELDNIEGILHVRDLLAFCEPGKLSEPVSSCMRAAHFVPESKSIAELLEEMQKKRIQIAIVVDEYGAVAGLVTVEDIVEEVVGEIEDEDRATHEAEIVETDNGTYLVDGSAEIDKVEQILNREIQGDDFTTVAGLIINELGRVPEVGEKLEYQGLEFEVADADNRRINRVKLRALESKPQRGSASDTAPE